MKLFRTSQNFIFSFGFDVVNRVQNDNIICWNSPETGEWEPKVANLAGCMEIRGGEHESNNGGVANIEFVHEVADGTIVAYSPGRCIEIKLIGGVFVFAFRVLKANQGWLTAEEARKMLPASATI